MNTQRLLALVALVAAATNASCGAQAPTAPQAARGAAVQVSDAGTPLAAALDLDASDLSTKDVSVALVEDAGASECVHPRWRIEYEHTGESGFVGASHTSAVLCDNGSFKGSLFSTHATASQAHDAQALLIEMRQRGQLWGPVTSRPPNPTAGCGDCGNTEMRVTLDGVEYFVNLAARDTTDPPPPATFGQSVVWANQRAARLRDIIESIGPEREGQVAITGKLPPEVIKRIVRQSPLRSCYLNALRGSRGRLAGTVTVRFVIDRTGAVSSAVQEPSAKTTDISDTSFVDCVVRRFGSLSFPAPEDGTVTVVYQRVYAP